VRRSQPTLPCQRLRAADVGEEIADLLIGQRVSPRGMKTAVGPPPQRTHEAPGAAGASRPVIPPREQTSGHEGEAGAFHLLDLVLRKRDVFAVRSRCRREQARRTPVGRRPIGNLSPLTLAAASAHRGARRLSSDPARAGWEARTILPADAAHLASTRGRGTRSPPLEILVRSLTKRVESITRVRRETHIAKCRVRKEDAARQ